MRTIRTLCSTLAVLIAGSALAFSANSVSGSLTVQNANSNAGACTALSCVQNVMQISSPGTIFYPPDAKYQVVAVQVTGTWSGTISFQESQDEGATWTNMACMPVISTATNVSPVPAISTTANGNWKCQAAGYTNVRAVMSTFSSGTAVVLLETFTGNGAVEINALPISTDAVQRTQSGNSNRVSYTMPASITVPTSAASMAAVEADGTNRLYLRHVRICPGPGLVQTTAGYRTLLLFKTTAASSGGSTQTPNPLDVADSAFGGVGRVGAITTTPAIGSVTVASALDSWTLWVPATVAAETAQSCAESFYGDAQGQKKPPVVAKGTANGLALADFTGGAGGAGVYIAEMDFTTELN